MRVLLVAAMVLSLATPSFAQGPLKESKQPAQSSESQKEKREKAEAEEKAANTAVGRLPDKKFDPWRTVR